MKYLALLIFSFFVYLAGYNSGANNMRTLLVEQGIALKIIQCPEGSK